MLGTVSWENMSWESRAPGPGNSTELEKYPGGNIQSQRKGKAGKELKKEPSEVRIERKSNSNGLESEGGQPGRSECAEERAPPGSRHTSQHQQGEALFNLPGGDPRPQAERLF